MLSGEKEAAHGLAPSLWIYDELGIAPNRQLLDALQTASGKRDRSLGIAISTQAADDRHPFSQLIDDATKSEDPTIVVQLIAAGVDEDPFDEAVIRRVNPAWAFSSTSERYWRRPPRRSARRRSSLSSETCGLTNGSTRDPRSGC